MHPKPADPLPANLPVLNPYFTISISIVLDAAAQVMLKIAANHSAGLGGFGLAVLHSGWGWCGILALVSSLGSWLYSLRYVPLNIAANLTAAVHVMVPLACWALLGEKINPLRWAGIALVIAGVYMVARPLMKAEHAAEERL
jgi:drug/metabolite transporter (DMT)-like permease